VRLRNQVALGGVALLVVAGLTAQAGNNLGKPSGVDTTERRRYTLVANTHQNVALLDVLVTSNLRDDIIVVDNRVLQTPWERSFVAEPYEIVTIDLQVWTRGVQPLGVAPWSRCEILLDGDMLDTEVDQRPVVRDTTDQRRQALAQCDVARG